MKQNNKVIKIKTMNRASRRAKKRMELKIQAGKTSVIATIRKGVSGEYSTSRGVNTSREPFFKRRSGE